MSDAAIRQPVMATTTTMSLGGRISQVVTRRVPYVIMITIACRTALVLTYLAGGTDG